MQYRYAAGLIVQHNIVLAKDIDDYHRWKAAFHRVYV